MQIKRYTITLLSALVCWTAQAQSHDDTTIFGAMETELTRSMEELGSHDADKPFWMGYLYADIRTMYVSASLGEVIQSQLQSQRLNATRVLFGDYDMTSDIHYNTGYLVRGSAIETDGDQIRREFWLNTDANYKQTAPAMARKAAMRRQSSRTPEEEELPDLLPVGAVEKIAESPEFGFDRKLWERRLSELSALFADFPSLYDSEVSVTAYDWTNWAYTSEDVRMRHPMCFASVHIRASVRTTDGEEFSDQIDLYAPSDLTLPGTEFLEQQLLRFARNLNDYALAPVIDEFYSGPVLFVGQPVFRMFDENLLSNNGNGLLVRRRSENAGHQGGGYGGGGQPSVRRLENRIGQRVLDRKFSVVNHSALRDYGGVPLLGHYQIDANGVVPPEELRVVDSGTLLTVLNGRIPTLKSRLSTGSNRFSLNVSPIVAPGTLEISVSEGTTTDELIGQLLALAKADGLEYAYIVERINGRINLMWKVDAETGERHLVRNAELTPVSLTQLKRVAGVCSESEVRNYLAGQVPASMIYPAALLLEDVEIGEMESSRDKPSPIVNPLQRP